MIANPHPNFERDPYPGKPRLLFISRGYSSHTTDWINLLDGADFNVRLFSLPDSAPPHDWPFRTYVTGLGASDDVIESSTRHRWRAKRDNPPALTERAVNAIRREIPPLRPAPTPPPDRWLIDIIEAWQPDIIQTLSMGASRYFYDACQTYNYAYSGVWMAMIWGAPDIVLQKDHPIDGPALASVLQAADYVFSDTEECMNGARQLGLQDRQIPEYYLFPGAGGVDVDRLMAQWSTHNPPSRRRALMWPKSYNNYYTSAMSTLEGIKLAWEHIQPCEIVIPNLKPDAAQWFHTLPEPIKAATRIPPHMPHADFQTLMTQMRVLLSPSLLDGLPNVLVDALACGAFPIVSPLGGLTPILTDEQNTLFARNLYPQEIADAIIRAMNDDALVDSAAQANLDVVRRIAERAEIRRQVLDIYQQAAVSS